MQAGGIFVTVAGRGFGWWMGGSVLLGLGTAMVYPSLIAAVSDNSHPSWRPVVERLPLLAGPRLRRGRALRGDHRGHVGAIVGDRLRRAANLPLGGSGSRVLERDGAVVNLVGEPSGGPIHPPS